MKPTINVDRLKQKLFATNASIAWLTYFEESVAVKEIQTVPRLHNVEYMFYDGVVFSNDECQKDFKDKFQRMVVSEEDVLKIEKLTDGQNKNNIWHSARNERITSSNFGSVCKLRADTKPDNTLKSILGYRKFESKFCDWGMKHEPAARKMYSNSLENVHVKTCGLLVNSKYPHLGASPDGLVVCVKENERLLEIKCPAADKWKFQLPAKCAENPEFFCCKDEHDSVRLKRAHNYFYQVQGQMLISGRKWCDFVVWTLKGWTVERICFDEEFCNNMVTKLDLFYMQNVIPELFSWRVKRGLPLYSEK